MTVLLTQRTDDMPSHAGQIAFPGGRPQASDADAVATALRETEEEVGLAQKLRRGDRLGRPLSHRHGLRDHAGRRHRDAGIHRPVPIRARWPTSSRCRSTHFLDERNHHIQSRLWQGRERRYYAMPYGERYIWGATAGMLKNLQFVLSADDDLTPGPGANLDCASSCWFSYW